MAWYREHGREELPWRRTRDAYAVLVSEFMLQQTQVERVLPYYETWLERWPTASALAAASPAEAIEAWAGLGYNRRAVHLHRAATIIARDGMPRAVDGLRTLPGVGAYTADAVACFAFGQATPVADTNIARVLARARLGVAGHRDTSAGEIDAAARELLPRRNSRDHNLAFMDLGALVCTARSPKCEECPLSAHCAWRTSGYPPSIRASRPVANRFATTARFARGRIVDHLRGVEMASADDLAANLPSEHRERIGAYLAALERDGVVERCTGGFRLPV